MNENIALFNEVKDGISKLARSMMDFSKNSFEHNLKYMSTLNIPSALHGFDSYDHMIMACKSSDESISLAMFLSEKNYDRAMYQIRKNSPELTIAQQDALLNKLVELDDLIFKKNTKTLTRSSNISFPEVKILPTDSNNIEEKFIQLIEKIKDNKTIGDKNLTIKRKFSNSWRFIYTHIPLNNKLGFNVFSDIKNPEKDLTVSVELSFTGSKSELAYFDDFLNKANLYANEVNADLVVKNLVALYKQPTNKNYAKASFEKVLFQSPAGSIYGVNTVLDGIECIQMAKYKGKLDPSIIECVLEQGIKLVEHLIAL